MAGAEFYRAAASCIELALVDRLADRVTIHAGVVAVDRRALLLPGRSHAGKSTLVRALLDGGASYYSDEVAVLDAGGRVHPYPRALSMRTPAGTIRVPPQDLACSVGTGPLPVGLVADLRHEPGTGWRVEGLSPGEAVLRLVEDRVNVRRAPERALTALTAVATGCVSIAGSRGEAAQAVRLLLDRLAQAAALGD